MSMDANVFVPLTKLKGKNECVQNDFLEEYIIQNEYDDRVRHIRISGVRYSDIPAVTRIC